MAERSATPTPSKDRSQPPSRVLSLIIPVYNEAENVEALVVEIEKHIPRPFVANIVYDFEEDTTVPVVQSLSRSRPWLRLVKNNLGRGVVFALRAGFEAVAEGPAVVVMADLSDDLSIVPRMIELYDEGYQVVCPSRYMPGGKQIGGPLLKRIMSRLAGLSLHWFAGLPTHDATNNFRLYDAALVNEMGIESSGGFEVALELTAKAFRRRARITEVPCTWRDRTAGESRFQLWKWLPKYLKWYFHALGSVFRRAAK